MKNVKVYSVASPEIPILEFGAKIGDDTAIEKQMQFSQNDDSLIRATSGGVVAYNLQTQKTAHSEQRSIRGLAVAPTRNDGSLWIAYVADGANKQSPTAISTAVVDYDSSSIKVIVTKSVYKVQDVELSWNISGTHVLVKTHSDVDETGKSYYGASALYGLSTKPTGGALVVVPRDKSPVNLFAWSNKNPTEFVLSYGAENSIEVWDVTKGKAILSLGQSRRNYAAYSSHGNLCLLGGFGSLPGNIDVWDLGEQKAVIGMSKVPWTVDCAFSPDSYWLLCATTTPRLRVDNGIQILRISGDVVLKQPMDGLYRASWKPNPSLSQRRPSCNRKLVIPNEKMFVPKNSAIKSDANGPVRFLKAVPIGAGGSHTAPSGEQQWLPPGLSSSDVCEKKKKKKSSGKKATARAALPQTFSIEEPTQVNKSECKSKQIDTDDVSTLEDAALARKVLKTAKLLREIRKLKEHGDLDENQRQKIAKEDDLCLEEARLAAECEKRSLAVPRLE